MPTTKQDQSSKILLKAAKAKADTTDGEAVILLKVPGSGRYVAGGQGWFCSSHHDDDEIKIYITDEDNILGGGAGAVIGGYVDDELGEANQGMYFSPHDKKIHITAISEIGFIPAGLYIKIVVCTGNSRSDTFRCNIKWGKR